MKIPKFLERYLTIQYLRRKGVTWTGELPIFDNVLRPPQFAVYGKLTLGSGVKFFTHLGQTLIQVDPGATITIGDHSVIGSGTWIRAAQEITIGKCVLISRLVDIFDTNMHPVDPHDKQIPKPVILKDNSWISVKSTLLPGTIIGKHSVVTANSVIRQEVPARVLFGGNPARSFGPVKYTTEAWVRVEF